MSMILGMFIGLFGGYIFLYNDLLKYGRECGFRCDRCKCKYCIAKRCWFNYNNLHIKKEK